MEYKSDVNVPLLVTLGLAGALALVVTIVGVQAWVGYQDNSVMADESKSAVVRPLADLREAQLKNIQTTRTDTDGKTIAIPIEQAMRILIAINGVMPTTRPTTRPGT